jgi:hypothetical protein
VPSPEGRGINRLVGRSARVSTPNLHFSPRSSSIPGNQADQAFGDMRVESAHPRPSFMSIVV